MLFKGVRENTQVWMSHGDTITAIPDNFKKIASTDKVDIAAYQVEGERYGAFSSIRKCSIAKTGRRY